MKRIEAALARLASPERVELSRLLGALEGPGAAIKRALLLRAVAARAEQRGEGVLSELRPFAERLAGLEANQARERATVLDLEPERNDYAFNPSALWERRGVIHERGEGDFAADNDGLSQRFTASCGPTVIQMMLAEADPLVAFAIHDAGLRSEATDDPVARFQRELLERLGGIAIGRQEGQLRARLRNALGRLESRGRVTDADGKALLRHVLEGGEMDAGARAALAAVRTAYGSFPDDEALSRLRRERIPKADEGVGTAEFQRALDTVISPATGIRYVQTAPPEGFARGKAAQHLDEVARALREGNDVPFGICEPAHWMLLTAVKGRKPDRSFLVSDPDGGRTAWVTEADLVRGVFAERQFHLPKPGERPYVDCFFLPSRVECPNGR
ncbi:MAG: hypothetical protein HYZ28_14055 [Myxococcales bacterium]|nr:hypothetical protein [Myxococcales bacterium]